jgi:cytoskeletal protein RodZ
MVQTKIPQSPSLSRSNTKKKQRSRLSTFTNLLALVALFSVVFALQYVSNKNVEDKAPPAEVIKAESATKQIEPNPVSIQKGTERTDSTVVDLSSLSTPSKPAEPKVKKAPKIYAPKNNTVRKPRAVKRDIAAEDRRLSAKLVEDLDGRYNTTYRSTDYSSYDKPAEHSEAHPFRYDLDDEVARQHYLATNRIKIDKNAKANED